MALATWYAEITRSIAVSCISGLCVGVVQRGSKISRRMRRKSNMLPWGQYSMMTQTSHSRPVEVENILLSGMACPTDELSIEHDNCRN